MFFARRRRGWPAVNPSMLAPTTFGTMPKFSKGGVGANFFQKVFPHNIIRRRFGDEGDSDEEGR